VTTKIPTEPGELEAMLRDQEKVNASIKDGTYPDLIKAYVAATTISMQDVMDSVKTQAEAAVIQMLKDNNAEPNAGGRINFNPYEGGPNNKYSVLANKRAVGAPLNGMFDDIGEYFQAVWHGGNPNQETRDKLTQILDYQEKVPSEGGFLVPEEFRAELLRLSLESAIVRPRARVVPMGSATLRFPMIDSTSNVSSVYGGIVVYRTEEGAELVESQASFGSIKLEATKQTALAHVTNELVRDAAGGFGMFIEQIFPEAMSYYEDVDFLSGTGVGEPLGVLNAGNTATIVVPKAGGQGAATIVWENVIAMYSRMLPASLSRAVWLASPDTFAELATMALSVGTGGSAVWLTDAHGAPVLTLLGRPIIMTEKTTGALGAQGDLSFVDLGMYLIGDRQMMTVDSSQHVKFTSDKTTYRVIQRNDGRPWLQSAITPRNNSATLSPFVQLAVRS
jgi:HK97 family phage major capsid protein